MQIVIYDTKIPLKFVTKVVARNVSRLVRDLFFLHKPQS